MKEYGQQTMHIKLLPVEGKTSTRGLTSGAIEKTLHTFSQIGHNCLCKQKHAI